MGLWASLLEKGCCDRLKEMTKRVGVVDVVGSVHWLGEGGRWKGTIEMESEGLSCGLRFL